MVNDKGMTLKHGRATVYVPDKQDVQEIVTGGGNGNGEGICIGRRE